MSPLNDRIAPRRPSTIEELDALTGVELGPTAGCIVDQQRIDEFAAATGDSQWIHTDVERATAELGSTIAHGMLTLSLGVKFLAELISFDGFERTINYGFEKVRFPETVPVGSELSMRAVITHVAVVDGGAQAAITQTIERPDAAKPVCVAQALARFYL